MALSSYHAQSYSTSAFPVSLFLFSSPVNANAKTKEPSPRLPNIVISNMHYTDADDVEHTQDVLFSYVASDDSWLARSAYSSDLFYFPLKGIWTGRSADGSYKIMPDEFRMTREQVEAMHVDANSDQCPTEYLIYDGTVYPGTPSWTIE